MQQSELFHQFQSADTENANSAGAQGNSDGKDQTQNVANQTEMSSRNLKIEEDGDRWRGIKPKIRLRGYWLERAGFKPGSRVSVNCIAPGVMELRSNEAVADLTGGAK